jgi:hypothetical protein
VVEVDVCNHWQGAEFANAREAVENVASGDGDADDLRPCVAAGRNLREHCVGVSGISFGHGLNGDGSPASD